jgi:osmotically inducible protein OsmC
MIRNAEAVWKGPAGKGNGVIALGSGAMESKYSLGSRFETDPGTNPEELIAGAHAGCFSMALAVGLTKNGFSPESINTTAKVHIEKVGEGFEITKIELSTVAVVPGISEDEFMKFANGAKEGCPVSKALKTVPIELTARLDV